MRGEGGKEGRKGKKKEKEIKNGERQGGREKLRASFQEQRKEGRQIFWVWRKKKKREKGEEKKRSMFMKVDHGHKIVLRIDMSCGSTCLSGLHVL